MEGGIIYYHKQNYLVGTASDGGPVGKALATCIKHPSTIILDGGENCKESPCQAATEMAKQTATAARDPGDTLRFVKLVLTRHK